MTHRQCRANTSWQYEWRRGLRPTAGVSTIQVSVVVTSRGHESQCRDVLARL
jgi:hypothetical protein